MSCSKESSNMSVEKNPQSNDELLSENDVFQLPHKKYNENYSSRQLVPIHMPG